MVLNWNQILYGLPPYSIGRLILEIVALSYTLLVKSNLALK